LTVIISPLPGRNFTIATLRYLATSFSVKLNLLLHEISSAACVFLEIILSALIFSNSTNALSFKVVKYAHFLLSTVLNSVGT
jgi:hypothetical protein